jgi:hypothetical protein
VGRAELYSRSADKTVHRVSTEQDPETTDPVEMWDDFAQAHWPEFCEQQGLSFISRKAEDYADLDGGRRRGSGSQTSYLVIVLRFGALVVKLSFFFVHTALRESHGWNVADPLTAPCAKFSTTPFVKLFKKLFGFDS